MNQRHVLFVCLIVSVLYWCPSRHVCCTGQQESSSIAANFAPDNSFEEKPKQDAEIESTDVKPPDVSSQFADPLEDYTKVDQQQVNSEQASFLDPGLEASIGLEDPPSSVAASPDNISSSSTSESSPFSQHSAIENSSDDIPILKYEQSEADCDAGGKTEAIPQSEFPSFIILPESPEDHIDGKSISSHGKEKASATDSEFDLSETQKMVLPNADNLDEALENTSNDSHDMEIEENAEFTTVSKIGDIGDSSSVITSKDSGDIPSFDEWKKKVMEEEKEKSQSKHATSGGQHSVKKVQKNFNNYASVECGAKILAANPEAKSNSAILMENMDLYMLNPCSAKIWFVIELCEPIQVRQLDIANFELFSSTPKDFLVSISDRYPTNKWVKLGTFHARDERTVQSFPLDEQMYAKYVKMFIKYIKVELVSHFGAEHFCPLSLIRVFGTSMVEEYEEIADSQYNTERLEYLDEDYDYPLDYGTREDKSSKNLLGSAKNVILNMVNIAANILGAKKDPAEISQTEVNGSMTSVNETSKLDVPVPGSSVTPSPAPELDPVIDQSVIEDDDKPDSPDLESQKENLIVQLVQEEEEEPLNRQSTVTLLEPEYEEDDRDRWFDTETQVYCSDLPLISCISSFSEYIYKWCSVIMALQRQRSKMLSIKPKEELLPAIQQVLTIHDEEVPSANETEEAIQEKPVSLLPAKESKSASEAQSSSSLSENLTNRTDSIELEPSRPPPASHSPIVSTSDIKPDVKHTAILQSSDPVLSSKLDDPMHLHPELTTSIQTTEVKLEATHNQDSSEEASPILETETVSETKLNVNLNGSTKENQNSVPVIIRPSEPIQTTDGTDGLTVTATEVPNNNGHGKGFSVETEQPLPPPDLDVPISPVAVSSVTEMKDEEQVAEDILLSVPSSNGLNRSVTDFYAEMHNVTDMGYTNGNQMHGSNQKESVFMRLNNRIKALEMNMSLSSRYLEELSQRYRKQMEEMQKAFNKTIIKLQNTSRMAEEKDQRQTEAIGLLQAQIGNMSQLVRNLSKAMETLKVEVSDRQSYLVISLAVCIILALLLCVQRCWNVSLSKDVYPITIPKSNHYPSPKRCFSSYDDLNLRRRTSYPLIRSKSFQLSAAEAHDNQRERSVSSPEERFRCQNNKSVSGALPSEGSTVEVGPDDLYIVEPLKFLQDNKKKKRCKNKVEKIDTIKAAETVIPIVNGGIKSGKPLSNQSDFSSTGVVYSSSHKGPPSEGGSETSSQSEESYFCGISACTSLCNGQPQKTKTEKRSFKRKKSKVTDQGKFISNLIQTKSGSLPSLHEIMKGNQNITVGTLGVTAHV